MIRMTGCNVDGVRMPDETPETPLWTVGQFQVAAASAEDALRYVSLLTGEPPESHGTPRA